MPKDVDAYVAENRQRIREVDSRFVQVDSQRQRDLSFGANFFTVDVDVTVNTRSTGDQVVFGHPSESKGFGRGTFGEDRGDWQEDTAGAQDAVFTKQGRQATAEALAGRTGAVANGLVGGSTATPTTNDTALTDRIDSVEVFANRTGNTLFTTASFTSTDVPGEPGEFGVTDRNNRLLCRVTVDKGQLTVDPTEDVQAVISLTFQGDGNGSSVVTNEGEEALADSLRTPTAVVGPTEFAFGSGTSAFSKTDTSLTVEDFRVNAGVETGRDRIFAFCRVPGQDVTTTINEVGLFDNNGRMIWAATYVPIEANTPGFTTDVSIVVN